MSETLTSSNLRRSTRTVIPTTPFTIENSSPIAKKKKVQTPVRSVPTPASVRATDGAMITDSIVDQPVYVTANITETREIEPQLIGNCLAPCTENGVPLTTYSDNRLDSVINKDSRIVGGILRSDIHRLRGRGMNITVKQLLAKNFKNYRVRQSLTSERATEIVNRTLSENEVPQGAYLSKPPMIPPTVKMGNMYQTRRTRTNFTLQNSLESLVKNAPDMDQSWKVNGSSTLSLDETMQKALDTFIAPRSDFVTFGADSSNQTLQSALASLVASKEDPLSTFNPMSPTRDGPQTLRDVLKAQAKAQAQRVDTSTVPPILTLPEIKQEPTDAELGLDEFATQILSSPCRRPSSDLDPIAYPGNHLPWPVLWKHVPVYTRGEIYCYVDTTVYSPMSEIIKSGKFMVPLDKPVGFIYNDKPIHITLNELLTANGINLSNTQHYRMLQGLLQKAGVHIRADYAERLHELQAVSNKVDIDEKPRPPIQLTPDKLPLMCIYPDIYMNALGRRLHGAVIVDSSGDKDPLPGRTFLTTIYSEPIPFDTRRQLLILHDAEIPIDQIAARFGCTIRSIQETIGTRVLIERHLIDQHFLEEPALFPDSPNATTPSKSNATIGEMIRPKNKIRRTHYVELNKLVWKHFKDCQATGIQINGKHLKDQAMRYAREMGLDTFRGSEGWLDAFKRRHRIDLKSMTGYPVCYENDMIDDVDRECRELDMESHNLHHQTSSFFPHGNTGNSAPDEFAASFFSSLSGFPTQMIPEPSTSTSSSNHLQNMINSMMTTSSTASSCMVADSSTSIRNVPSTSSSDGDINLSNVLRSCQIKVADKEVSHALDTLRTFILAHDPGAMSFLVTLQERLASTCNVGTELLTSSSS